MNCRGFTLTEVLVAMLLFSLASAGGLTAWAHGHAAWQEAAREQLLHERAQYVMATLEPELQMAGYFGQSPPEAGLSASEIPAAAQTCGAGLIARLTSAIEVAPAYDLPCAARGGAATGSAQLTIRRTSAQAANPSAGRAQWLAGPTSGELTWNDGSAPAPGTGTERRDLLVRVYYVARAADNDPATPALRVKNLSSIAGSPAFIDTEVMPGVESLQAELLPTAAAARSVRITLVVVPDQAEAGFGQAMRRITVTRLFTLRNAYQG
jgi:prepilin-type N-terminal cleavage/methylation domain-containing protein